MGKKRKKPAPGQKGLSSEFTSTPRQKRLAFSPAGGQPKREHQPFVPGPNQDIGKFVAAHSRPVDEWMPASFDLDLVGQKTSALYTFHTYWSKKDPALIQQYVAHYTRPGELVVDPFSGSGTTGLASLLSGRAVVLIDASPSAALLSHFCCMPGSPEDVQDGLDQLLNKVEQEINSLFATKCDRCGGPAIIEYVIWSERFQCPKCAEYVPLFDCPEVRVELPVPGRAGKRQLRKKRVCPFCLVANEGTPHREFVISTRAPKKKAIPVLVRYRCAECRPAIGERRHNDDSRTRKGKYFGEVDLARLEEITKHEIPHWYPRRKMMDVEDDSKPWGMEWRPGRNFRSVAELYTRRNLWALAALRTALANTNLGQLETLLFTGLVHKCSHLMGCGGDQVGRVKMGTYYLAPIRMECRPTKYLGEALSDLKRHFKAKSDANYEGGDVIISEANATEALRNIPDSTVDYVFTDPPYVDKIQYGELNFLWEAWLGLDGSWLANEIVLNPFRKKRIADWDTGIRRVMAEVYRILKPGRWLSLCYHDTDPRTWTLVQNLLRDVGFEIGTVTAQSTSQKSANQITGEKVVKSDLVVNCQKPASGGCENRTREVGLASQRVREILVEALSQTAGQTRDMLWDIVLRRLLTRGQMAEHRFDDVLADIAFRSESGRWFLKEEFESLSQGDIKNEEAAGDGLTRFARLRCAGVPVNFAAHIALASPRLAGNEIDEGELESHIKSKLITDKDAAKKFALGGRMKGVEFYDCLFFYLTRFLKGRSPSQSPRRNLAEFLEEYLVHFKDGDKWLYRVPDAAEAEALRKSRQSGLGRRIRQYVAFLRGEGEFPAERRPDAKTSVAWLKHCANFGLADEGVLLFEKGGMAAFLNQLSEDDRYDAEDYYAQCRRKAAKAAREDEDDEDENTDDED